jgi:hypothetical protein
MGTPILPQLPPWLAFTQGQIWHVKPSSGLDTNTGKSTRNAFKTLAKALSSATANQNDVVLLYGESNTSASTTDYQSATLDWNKDLVHLIGVNSGVSMSSRSRIAPISTYTSATPTMQVSANGCYFANLSIWMGVADTTPLGALKVTGSRNRFDNCHILGMGVATNDVAGAYSLLLSGAEECEFRDCVIGSNRIALGAAANSHILCAASAKNILFRRCRIKLYTAHATNSLFLRAATGSLDGDLEFEDCAFENAEHRSGGTALTYGFVVAADAGGDVILSGTSGVMATDVNSTDAGNVYGVGGVATAGTFGLAAALTK